MKERIRFERELSDLSAREMRSPPPLKKDKWLKLFPDAKRNKADFLIDGEDYFQSAIWAIETAKTKYDYIYIMGWMLDIDFPLIKSDKNKTLYNLLKDRAERGVEIRILVWDNLIPDYARLNTDAIQRLGKLPNAKIFIDEHTFFPAESKKRLQTVAPYLKSIVDKYGRILMSPEFRVQQDENNPNKDIPGSYIVYRLLTLYNQQTIGAHHEKVLIVKGSDGLIGFCGGIDFNKNRVLTEVDWPKAGFFKSKTAKKEFRFPYYHDNACRLQGPAAYDVLQKFKKRWSNHPAARKVSLLGAGEGRPPERAAPYPYAKVVGTYNGADGKDRDRSLRDAYLKIIENAESYIYIEDQYLVNLDVTNLLNKKIKEPKFQKLTFAIQDSIETADIFIPNRKRGEFLDAVYRGADKSQKDKVLLAVLDRKLWDKDFYHPGMHAKTLIVDDEIAIIGSANVNQRSFTCDSETSVVVFDDAKTVDQNFAKKLRVLTWKGFLRRPTDKIMYESWWNFPTEISRGNKDFSILVKYEKDEQDDLDLRLTDAIKKSGVVGAVAAYKLSGKDLAAAQSVLSGRKIKEMLDLAWQYFVDPVCP